MAETAPIVIVGGGLAAGTVATELREGGYDGPLAVYTDEAHPPYERPPLSKDFMLDKGPLTPRWCTPRTGTPSIASTCTPPRRSRRSTQPTTS